MSKLHKAFNWAFWPVIGGMMIASLSINVYDRFAYQDESSIFYSKALDATCLTTMAYGKPVIFCFDGDRMSDVEAE